MGPFEAALLTVAGILFLLIAVVLCRTATFLPK